MATPREFELSDIDVTMTDDKLEAIVSCLTIEDESVLLTMKRAVLANLRQRADRALGRPEGLILEGDTPFEVTPARGSTARVSGRGVKMTVYVSVAGKGPTDVQIQVPMTPGEARQLAADLTVSAATADARRE
jgi:hypothetical protein